MGVEDNFRWTSGWGWGERGQVRHAPSVPLGVYPSSGSAAGVGAGGNLSGGGDCVSKTIYCCFGLCNY